MNIKIEIKIKNKVKLLANANLILLTNDFGWVSIKDFQIWESNVYNKRLQDFINIKPPSVRVFGRYLDRIFFEDSEQWEILEKLIFDAYKQKQAELAPINYDAINNLSK
jgi:hypothetical protein